MKAIYSIHAIKHQGTEQEELVTWSIYGSDYATAQKLMHMFNNKVYGTLWIEQKYLFEPEDINDSLKKKENRPF